MFFSSLSNKSCYWRGLLRQRSWENKEVSVRNENKTKIKQMKVGKDIKINVGKRSVIRQINNLEWRLKLRLERTYSSS